jgi:hypothetical protein
LTINKGAVRVRMIKKINRAGATIKVVARISKVDVITKAGARKINKVVKITLVKFM